MTPDDFLTCWAEASAQVLADGPALLATAGYWLDPMRTEGSQEDGWWYDRNGVHMGDDGGDNLWIVAGLSRDMWHNVYANLVYDIREGGMSDYFIEQRAVDAINLTCGHEVIRDPEFCWYGPDIEFYGTPVNDYDEAADFWERDPAAPYARLLLSNDRSYYGAAGFAGTLADALQAEGTPIAERLHWLVLWLAKMSGNTSLDYSYFEARESFDEFPDWGQLDYAIEIMDEAEAGYRMAQKGLEALIEDDDLHIDFCSNILIAHTHALQERFHDHRTIRPDFIPVGRTEASDTSGTAADAAVHALRDRAA